MNLRHAKETELTRAAVAAADAGDFEAFHALWVRMGPRERLEMQAAARVAACRPREVVVAEAAKGGGG